MAVRLGLSPEAGHTWTGLLRQRGHRGLPCELFLQGDLITVYRGQITKDSGDLLKCSLDEHSGWYPHASLDAVFSGASGRPAQAWEASPWASTSWAFRPLPTWMQMSTAATRSSSTTPRGSSTHQQLPGRGEVARHGQCTEIPARSRVPLSALLNAGGSLGSPRSSQHHLLGSAQSSWLLQSSTGKRGPLPLHHGRSQHTGVPGTHRPTFLAPPMAMQKGPMVGPDLSDLQAWPHAEDPQQDINSNCSSPTWSSATCTTRPMETTPGYSPRPPRALPYSTLTATRSKTAHAAAEAVHFEKSVFYMQD